MAALKRIENLERASVLVLDKCHERKYHASRQIVLSATPVVAIGTSRKRGTDACCMQTSLQVSTGVMFMGSPCQLAAMPTKDTI
jgi:hypothetical protein